ncbi:hypothetical protein P344_06155 [Spiroplasma mirum ATCC 29335]|uniref:Uncharacterized protein n=1 Tax=Spiroplasma mirum ATCC 29335 TaxID=838561 RepID=W0GMK1_9MOLU|nr:MULTISPECIES: hypothetical protein [Spiroplasma]AHF61407.1 hypothetical protein SMM_1033 [Spiroplasma mirum ATCC 29335]AHI58538.1 hypothetical protein P344_06155 [Spiroplasma mirum ATCC 29335]AKM53461.1 hypothetical protein SATRI_v1c11020 [Spiroplasma atrichopogonis]
MGYYYQHNFNFSYHSLQRIKERIAAFKTVDEWIIKEKIIKMIDNSTDRIETTRNFYIKLDNFKNNLYVVINKHNNLIVTVTLMSPQKLLEILNEK